MDTLYVVLVW